MKFHPIHHTLTGSILSIASFLGVFQMTYAEGITKATIYPAIVSAESIFHAILARCDAVYILLHGWYMRNNTIVTVLPYILRVHILDFFVMLLWIVLAFWFVLRYLSR